MSDPLPVPDVTGSARAAAETALTGAGLVVGTATTASSPTVAAGNVIRTDPTAGTLVNPGTAVNLEVSSGPPQVAVPDVTGFTRAAAETALRIAGLVLGTVATTESNTVPMSGVISTNPPAGRLVNPGSRIDLEVSIGQTSSWWRAYLPGAGIFAVVLVILAVVVIGLYSGSFLSGLSDDRTARGLITFLIAVVTVGIALILVLSNAFGDGADADRRFDRGKQVLTTMIGVLGTIVGFYFGSTLPPGNIQPAPSAAVSITTASLPDGTVNKSYGPATLQASGGTPPLVWSIAPALPAGLSLNPRTGVISGTPTTVSPRTNYKVTVTDSEKPPASSSSEIAIEVKQ